MHESGLSPFDFEAAASRHGLQQHADRLAAQGLQSLQSQDGRVQEWVLKPEGLGWRFDFTKQCIDSAAWRGLVSLAQDAEW